MKTYILFFLFIMNTSISFGQIYTFGQNKRSFTITPQGIKGKFPASPDITNVLLGNGAMEFLTTGTQNTSIGSLTLFQNKTGSQNTAFGAEALLSNNSGNANVAFGTFSLGSNNTASENVGFGYNSLGENTSLSRNVAIGSNALRYQSYDGNNTSENTAIGDGALLFNNPTDATNGRQNTAIGAEALYKNTIGMRNTAFGNVSLYNLTTGDNNVALGKEALYTNVAGSKNVAIGFDALRYNLGSGNVAIGFRAGYNDTGSNKLFIAFTEDEDTPLIGGDFAAKKVSINRNIVSTSNPNDFLNRTETLQVGGEAYKTSGNGNWIFPSDRRLKKNIVSLNSQAMLAKVLLMQGVTYEMKDESQKGIKYGFIAQDLREIFPTKVKENAVGYLSADYGSYDAIVVEAIKAMHQKIQLLKKNKEELERQQELLSQNIEALVERMNTAEATNIEKKSTNIKN